MTVVAGLDLSLTGTGIATPAGLTTIRSTPDSGTLTARRRRSRPRRSRGSRPG
mgnify:CR=1 FL=1